MLLAVVSLITLFVVVVPLFSGEKALQEDKSEFSQEQFQN
jgi:hypothetical protein